MTGFRDILKGEAYTKSQYMYYETLFMDFFAGQLTNLDYKSQDQLGRVWTRDQTKVVVCLSDDVYSFGTDSATPVGQELTKDTIVITDNNFLGMPKYKVFKFPDSYFGIYSYVPESQDWQPRRRFNFSVNRFDKQRLLILLELIHQSKGVDSFLEQDYVNFNVFVPIANNKTSKDIQTNFLRAWDTINFDQQNLYKNYFKRLRKEVPILNHDMEHNQSHIAAWLNVVVESYAGDMNRTVSEKTFRALVTPVPWTLYACRYTVEMLKSLGFDVLEDLVDHSYNKVLQSTTPDGIAKIQQFISSSIENQQRITCMDFDAVKLRCQKAATHNQKLLANLRKQWPQDFADWLPEVIKQLK